MWGESRRFFWVRHQVAPVAPALRPRDSSWPARRAGRVLIFEGVQRLIAYVGEVLIDPGVSAKIRTKHNLTDDEVQAACRAVVTAAFDIDPKRGRRLLLTGRGFGRILKVVLYPVDERDGTWRLATAFAARP